MRKKQKIRSIGSYLIQMLSPLHQRGDVTVLLLLRDLLCENGMCDDIWHNITSLAVSLIISYFAQNALYAPGAPPEVSLP